MLNNEEKERLRQGSFVPRVLCLAMVCCVLTYVGVSYLSAKEPASALAAPWWWVLSGVALCAGIGSLAVFPIFLPASKLRDALAADDRVSAVLEAFFTPFILRIALAEAVSVFGLMLAHLSGEPSVVLPFAGSSLLLLLFAYPTTDSLRRRLIGL